MIMYIGVECDNCGKSRVIEIEQIDRQAIDEIDSAIARSWVVRVSVDKENKYKFLYRYFCSWDCWTKGQDDGS